MAARRVLVVSAAAKPQILDRGLAADRPRRGVIELQKSPRAAASPIRRTKRAFSAVAQVHLARRFDISRAGRFQLSLRSVRIATDKSRGERTPRAVPKGSRESPRGLPLRPALPFRDAEGCDGARRARDHQPATVRALGRENGARVASPSRS
jgi:hypothetical protein